MQLSDIYHALCALYGIRDRCEIQRFLLLVKPHVHDARIGNRLPQREALYIKQNADETLEIGLFIDPAMLFLLSDGDPLAHLDAFACAIEGVSHFLYVTDRHRKGMDMTQLELELQGEVDKFLILHLQKASEGASIDGELFHQQFSVFCFCPDLGDEERMRYATASYFAAKYCHRLLLECFNPLNLRGLQLRARTFFQARLTEKVKGLIP